MKVSLTQADLPRRFYIDLLIQTIEVLVLLINRKWNIIKAEVDHMRNMSRPVTTRVYFLFLQELASHCFQCVDPPIW